eukprot:Hpha_TRINITY_DN16730_c3_g1::TRINITY_DN16730_c3_g1_i2::g.79730::m.79730
MAEQDEAVPPPSSPFSAALAKERGYVFEDRLEAAKNLRLLGNTELKEGRVSRAISAYRRALDYHADFDDSQRFDFHEKHDQMLEETQLPLCLNLVQSLLRESEDGPPQPQEAVDYARRAVSLSVGSRSAKANYLLARALFDSGKADEASPPLAEAERLSPGDAKVSQLRRQIAAATSGDKERQRALFKNMGAGLAKAEEGQQSAEAKSNDGGRSWIWLAGAAAACGAAYLMHRFQEGRE